MSDKKSTENKNRGYQKLLELEKDNEREPKSNYTPNEYIRENLSNKPYVDNEIDKIDKNRDRSKEEIEKLLKAGNFKRRLSKYELIEHVSESMALALSKLREIMFSRSYYERKKDNLKKSKPKINDVKTWRPYLEKRIHYFEAKALKDGFKRGRTKEKQRYLNLLCLDLEKAFIEKKVPSKNQLIADLVNFFHSNIDGLVKSHINLSF